MNSRVMLSLTLLVLVAAGAFYAWQIEEPRVHITMHNWPGYFYAFIAADKGYFEEEGVHVELQLIEGIDDSLKSFAANETVDAAFGLQSDAMLLFARGVTLKIVYIADFSNGGDVVISQPSIESVEDLRGKTISVDKLNGFNHIFIVELLAMSGVKESEVSIVPYPASEVPDLMSRGVIDAGQTWEPYKSQALAAGYQLCCSAAWPHANDG